MASKPSALVILYKKFHPSSTRTIKMILMMATVMRGDMILVLDRSVSQHSRHIVCLSLTSGYNKLSFLLVLIMSVRVTFVLVNAFKDG